MLVCLSFVCLYVVGWLCCGLSFVFWFLVFCLGAEWSPCQLTAFLRQLWESLLSRIYGSWITRIRVLVLSFHTRLHSVDGLPVSLWDLLQPELKKRKTCFLSNCHVEFYFHCVDNRLLWANATFFSPLLHSTWVIVVGGWDPFLSSDLPNQT